jgi:putative hemolysin
VQVGITSIGVLNGIVGEAAFSGDVAQWLMGLGLSESASAVTATALVVTAITFTTIIFGELVPKGLGSCIQSWWRGGCPDPWLGWRVPLNPL